MIEESRRVLLLPVDAALLEHEVALAVVVDRLAALGEVDHRLAGLAPVLDEDAEQGAARAALAEMEGDAVVEGGELALLDDVGDEVAADAGHEVAQLLELDGIT